MLISEMNYLIYVVSDFEWILKESRQQGGNRLTVIKRDGRKVKFDKDKIKIAVLKAFIDVDGEETTYAKDKARDIAKYIESLDKDMSVEEIQDVV